MEREHFIRHLPPDIRAVVEEEDLLPLGLLRRLHRAYPQHSGLVASDDHFFPDDQRYVGIEGLRRIDEILRSHGIDIGHMPERELFIHVYRFMATSHVLNSINWRAFQQDPLYHLVIPQPGMIPADVTEAYLRATSEEERQRIVAEHRTRTNPHDGKQKLNKPWFVDDSGTTQILDGSQHKYPQCQLIFDVETQNCFAFCTYCFRHAQVRGDEDMFLQRDIKHVHDYVKRHKEITDILITGGDAGFITPERFAQYIEPIIEDPEFTHVRAIRLGTRVLTYYPQKILRRSYDPMLALLRRLRDNGIQPAVMVHFSTPREVLNPATVAAIRRLQNNGALIRSQSPIMRNVSLWLGPDGKVDVDKTAQNWIDLANVMEMLSIGFHSMYCARPTGEHHYFSAPLAELNEVFRKVYRSLPSIARPFRHLSMTSSAGKISILGTTEVGGQKLFALAFTQGRNPEWIDKVFLAHYDEKENTIVHLKPFDSDKFFFEDELAEIEAKLEQFLTLYEG